MADDSLLHHPQARGPGKNRDSVAVSGHGVGVKRYGREKTPNILEYYTLIRKGKDACKQHTKYYK